MVTESEITKERAFVNIAKSLSDISLTLQRINLNLEKIAKELEFQNEWELSNR